MPLKHMQVEDERKFLTRKEEDNMDHPENFIWSKYYIS